MVFMENKVEVEINGRIVRVAKHLLPDMVRFGATKPNQIKRDVPIELRRSKPEELLPKMVITEPAEVKKQVRKPRKK
jgi:hypothetical protein